MDKQAKKRRGPMTLLLTSRRFRRWAFAFLVSLPALYLLSLGPTCWWMARGIRASPGGPLIGDNAAYVPRIYWPIGWAVERYPTLRPMLAWYSRLFGTRTAVLLPVKS